MNKTKPWLACLSGGLAGVMNGLFGAGGGIILVPLLIQVHGLAPRKAFATSVAIILPLSVVSAIIYGVQGALPLAQSLPYVLGGVLGGAAAGKLMERLPVLWLRRGFGLLLIVGGLRAVLK